MTFKKGVLKFRITDKDKKIMLKIQNTEPTEDFLNLFKIQGFNPYVLGFEVSAGIDRWFLIIVEINKNKEDKKLFETSFKTKKEAISELNYQINNF